MVNDDRPDDDAEGIEVENIEADLGDPTDLYDAYYRAVHSHNEAIQNRISLAADIVFPDPEYMAASAGEPVTESEAWKYSEKQADNPLAPVLVASQAKVVHAATKLLLRLLDSSHDPVPPQYPGSTT